MNTKELFLSQVRFDLMFKYLYLKNQEKYGNFTDFFKNLYLEHIRIFNNFYERDPYKTLSSDFINGFETLYSEIKSKGFDKNSPIPINSNNQIVNGAHRLCCCFKENIDVETCSFVGKFNPKSYNYEYFRRRYINSVYSDYVALQYVKLNPKAYIVNLQPVTSPEFDLKVERILEKYGFIFYQKSCFVTFNGLVNLKKMFYGKEKWIGNVQNDFKGAQKHARNSSGPYPLRAFIFVCDDINNVVRAKKEIRDIYNIGNNSVHINDTHEEAIEIAECYFNDNSLFMLNNRPYNFEDRLFDNMLDKIVKSEEVCCCGSAPLNIFGIRQANDLDILSINPIGSKEEHNGYWETFYPKNKYEIILDPQNYFYYKGRKFITLDILNKMKNKRAEKKDIKDCELIDNFLENSIDYSTLQNTGVKIYQDVLQKLVSAVRAELLYKKPLKRRFLNIICPNRDLFRLYRYKFLFNFLSGSKKEHYRKKIKLLEIKKM